jgi:ankyrin repeat protein
MIARDTSTVAARDSAGDTPLHALAGSPDGTWQMARLLLDHNADPHALDAQGRTPLDRAKASGNTKVRAILDQVLTTRPSPKQDAPR